MWLDSTLSAVARPFQPQATSPSALVNDGHCDLPAWNGLTRGSPTTSLTPGSPLRGVPSTLATPLMTKEYPLIPLPLRSWFVRGVVAEGVEAIGVVMTPMGLSPLEGGKRKRIDFPVTSKYLNLGARRDTLTMWLMPLGSGPIVPLIIGSIMRIHTSCHWLCHP